MADGVRQKADRVFRELLDLPESEQERFLVTQCAGEAAVETLVRRLLAQTTGGDTRLDPGGGFRLIGVETGDFAPRPPSLLNVGDRISVFRLIRELGRGGMATVYLAERDDGQFEQTVALKILDRTGDTVARFEQERQILASLNHPNIARLVDGGVTDAGLPYVAMDYVEGEPILDYCDNRHLGIGQRLRLFLPVVDAVHYAHRKLIIHRDIKSANILVTRGGVPKLLDFGIAKLLEGGALPHAAPATRAVVPLTPEYASPEQIRGEAMTVPTDIYQLGFLLYLLLTGRTPYPTSTRDVAGLVEAITRRDPVVPSIRAAQPPDEADDVADLWESRDTTPARLRKRLAGDLDRIVLKALHKDPDHRYSSAGDFAGDIENVLEDRPITARPDTVFYRVGKFTKRHRTGVAATSIAVIAAITGTGAFTYRLAEEKEKAMLEAAKAQEVATFMRELFGAANPSMTGGEAVSARDVLDEGLEKIHERLDLQPEVKAELLDSMAYSYLELGEIAKAEDVLEEAIELRREHFGTSSRGYVQTLHRVAMLRYDQGRYGEAEELAREAYDISSRLLGDDDPVTQYALAQLGLSIYRQSRFEEAEALQRRRLDMTRRAFGDSHPDMVGAINNVAITLDMQGRNEEALELYRQSFELGKEVFGEKHPATMNALNNMGLVYERLRQFDESEAAFRHVIELRTEALGSEHPRTIRSLQNLASMLAAKGDYGEAVPLLEDLSDVSSRILGAEHPQTLWARMELAEALSHTGKTEQAEAMLRALINQNARVLGTDHYNSIVTRSLLARLLRERGSYEEAGRLLAETIDLAESSGNSTIDQLLSLMQELGHVRLESAGLESADRTHRETIDLLAERDETGGIHHGRYLAVWGDILVSEGFLDEAEPVLLEAIRIQRAVHGEDHDLTRETAASLSNLYTRLGRPAQADAYEPAEAVPD